MKRTKEKNSGRRFFSLLKEAVGDRLNLSGTKKVSVGDDDGPDSIRVEARKVPGWRGVQKCGNSPLKLKRIFRVEVSGKGRRAFGGHCRRNLRPLGVAHRRR